MRRLFRALCLLWCPQQGIDLRGGEEDGKTFLGFGQRDGHERVGGETFSLAEKAVKLRSAAKSRRMVARARSRFMRAKR